MTDKTKKEYIEEIDYFVKCLYKHQRQEAKLLAKKIALFRNYRLKVIHANIRADKQCINIYTLLLNGDVSSFNEGFKKIKNKR